MEAKLILEKHFSATSARVRALFLFLDWLIGVVTPGADRRQKYTDRMAGTTVVQGKQPFAPVTTATS